MASRNMEAVADPAILRKTIFLRQYQILLNERYKEGLFKIPIHLAIGHEAIAVAVDRAAVSRDALILSHRNIHYNLARLDKVNEALDEYFLLDTGVAGGKLGSMNMSNEKKNIVYTSNVLGNNLSVGCGYSLASKVRKEDAVTFVITGDGAIEEGSFYESILFASTHHLPLLIIIENNQWSLATSIADRRYDYNIQLFAESLDVGYQRLNGNDPFDYANKLTAYRDKTIREKRPLIVEVDVTTLGYWYKHTEGNPDGKFVNYHAGPAPEIEKSDYPMVMSDTTDPLFVLLKYLPLEKITILSSEIRAELEQTKL